MKRPSAHGGPEGVNDVLDRALQSSNINEVIIQSFSMSE